MKKQLLISLLTLAGLLPVSSLDIYMYTGPAYTIPVGNPNGVWSSVTVNGEAPLLTDVAVMLNLSGGYNGDLYAYLSYDGMMVPLLNRVGVSSTNAFGANGAGMNVTLSDGATVNIHAAGNGYLSGTYLADGQNINPLSAPGNFSANGGTITLDGTFGGLNPNGNWTLFIADVVSGGGATTLNSWGLAITAVPEPDVRALGAFALVFASACLRRWKSRK
jgi:hypothetical protein